MEDRVQPATIHAERHRRFADAGAVPEEGAQTWE